MILFVDSASVLALHGPQFYPTLSGASDHELQPHRLLPRFLLPITRIIQPTPIPSKRFLTMSAKTQYAPAPQRDSFEDNTASYSQAPPSYNAQTSASADQALLLGGGARSSEDNIPDDFKYGGSVAEASIEIRMQFVRKVYAILSVQLIATAILSSISFFSVSYKTWIQSNVWMMWVSVS